MRLPDLEHMAEQTEAVVWQGHVLSNRLQVIHAEPDVTPDRQGM